MSSVFIGCFNKSIQLELADKVLRAWNPRKYPLNEQQQAVVDWTRTGEGHCIVQARAGTGKTSLLLGLLPHIADSPQEVTAATMHSAGLSAWKLHTRNFRIKVNGDKMRGILDEMAMNSRLEEYTLAGQKCACGAKADWKETLELGGEQVTSYYCKLHIPLDSETLARSWGFMRKLVSFAKQSGFGIEDETAPQIDDVGAWEDLIDYYGLDTDLPDGGNPAPYIAKAQQAYRLSLDKCFEEVDFDDMLLAPLVHDCQFKKYDWVLGDEWQDSNVVRRKIAMKLLRPSVGRGVFVGDSFQAIYGFCGATSDSLNIMKHMLGEDNCIELPLTVTYRCPHSVISLAQEYVPDITAHENNKAGTVIGFGVTPPVYLEPENGNQKSFWRDCAPFTAEDMILCRNNRPLVELMYQFLRKRIPAYIEGRDIAASLTKLAQRWKLKTLIQLEAKLLDWGEKEAEKLRKKKKEGMAAEVEDKVQTMLVLIQATRDSGKHGITDLVELINSMFGDTPDGQKPKCLVLSSVHKAKGREAPRIFILGRERYMPSPWAKKDWEKQAEDNIAYVALTRPLDTLVDIVVPADKKKDKWVV